MEINEINPYIRFFAVIPEPVLKSIPHVAYDSRLFYVLNGDKVKINVNGVYYQIKKGAVFYIPSNTPYFFEFKSCKDLKFVIVNFDLTYKYSSINKPLAMTTLSDFKKENLISASDFKELCLPLCFEDGAFLRTDILNLIDSYSVKTTHYKELSSAILKGILIKLVSSAEYTAENSDVYLKISKFIAENYQEKFSAHILGEKLGYHPYYLNRIFKNKTGKTIHKYLNEYRISIAKKLLLHSELTVEDIAIDVGLENPSHFAFRFKKAVGVTPTEYRNSYLSSV